MHSPTYTDAVFFGYKGAGGKKEILAVQQIRFVIKLAAE
jgi:hypothetical protein